MWKFLYKQNSIEIHYKSLQNDTITADGWLVSRRSVGRAVG